MSNGPFAITKEGQKIVFIENACPGDLLEAEIYDTRKDFSYASVTKLLEESTERMSKPPCKIHKICGSCQWQHIDYQAQLKFKKQNLIDLLKSNHINYQDNVPDLIAMDNPWNYRNKIIYPVKTVPSTGRLQAGYFKRNSNELINVKYCPIQYSIFDEIVEFAKESCSQNSINDSFLRHIMLRANEDFSEILLCLISREKTLPSKEGLIKVLQECQKKFPAIKSTTINYNDDSTNVIMGKKTEVISGTGFITETFCDVKLQLSTQSFFQVNTKIFSQIIEKIIDFIEPNSHVIDLYCGIGTISLSLAKAVSNLDITGVEMIETAIENAEANAKLNHIDAKFHCSSIEDWLYSSQPEAEEQQEQVIILNPPRKGCSNQVLEATANLKAQRIIYVSCNPATLSRDLSKLENQNYKLEYIQSFDMFPHSFHFETLAVLKIK